MKTRTMKTRKKHTDCALLEHLSVIDRIIFANHVDILPKRYKKKEVLQLHESEQVGLLLDGIAILSQIDRDGEEILAKFISRNHIIDYPFDIEEEGRYEIELCQETTIIWLDRDRFYEYARNQPVILHAILKCEVAERRFLDKYLAATSQSRAQDKVMATLRWFAHTYEDDTFVIPLTYQRLASMLGISRDRLKECLMDLVEIGAISLTGLYIVTVHKKPRPRTRKTAL